MSTTPIETWAAADLTQIGPIYPFVGSEWLLIGLGIIFWLGFHITQLRAEQEKLRADEAMIRSPEQQNRLLQIFNPGAAKVEFEDQASPAMDAAAQAKGSTIEQRSHSHTHEEESAGV